MGTLKSLFVTMVVSTFIVTHLTSNPKKRGWKKLTFGVNAGTHNLNLKEIGRKTASGGIRAICHSERYLLKERFGIDENNLKPLWVKIERVIG